LHSLIAVQSGRERKVDQITAFNGSISRANEEVRGCRGQSPPQASSRATEAAIALLQDEEWKDLLAREDAWGGD
jgi:hypothetical protein